MAYEDEIRKAAKKEGIEDVDGLLDELYEVAELDMRTLNLKTFPLGSELEVLTANLLKKYIRQLDSLMLNKGYKLEIEWIDEAHEMFYTSLKGRVVVETDGPIKLLLRKDCPKMAWFHENRHIEDLLKFGRKKYRKMAFDEPWTLEWNVWEEILKTRNKYREVELLSAYKYVKYVYEDKKVLKLFKENKEMEQLKLKYK